MSSSSVMHKTPIFARNVIDEMIACLQVRQVPLLLGPPGLGKSSFFKEIARRFQLKLIDCRLSSYLPEDINGFPQIIDGKARYIPFDTFPVEGDEVPEGYNGWLLVLDEFTSMDKSMQAPVYRLTLDREVAQFNLHQDVHIVAAGNRIEDNAVAFELSTALKSRVTTYEVEADTPYWLDHAYRSNFDTRVTAYIGYSPDSLMIFDPDHQEHAHPCPRTWETISKFCEHIDHIDSAHLQRFGGTIGNGEATKFISFAQNWKLIPRAEQIIQDPKGTPVPSEASVKFATASMLTDHINDKTAEPILEYISQFSLEMQLLFARGALAKDETLMTKCEPFKFYMRDKMRYLAA